MRAIHMIVEALFGVAGIGTVVTMKASWLEYKQRFYHYGLFLLDFKYNSQKQIRQFFQFYV
jgi:hypothetical protein